MVVAGDRPPGVEELGETKQPSHVVAEVVAHEFVVISCTCRADLAATVCAMSISTGVTQSGETVRTHADGAQLRALRARARVSGADVERATGLPRGVVSAIERGAIYAYPRFRLLVSQFLGARLDLPTAEVHAAAFPNAVAPPAAEPAPVAVPPETAEALHGAGIDPQRGQELYRGWLDSVTR
jgi:transcriptional regulator with XRE-family HTH domain